MVLRAQPHVLVVDDDESAREAATILLGRWGNRVSVAECGEAGLDVVRRDPPDLCLVDLQMPGISGLDVLRAVKGIDADIQCVMVTGFATLRSAIDALQEGAYDFLAKPFSPDELKRAVDRALERRFLALETKSLREEKDRMEANFITMVSHQMRSPLAAVRQLMEVAATEALGPLPADYHDIVSRAARRMDELLQSIGAWLNMSQIEAKGVAERMEKAEVKPFIDLLTKRVEIEAMAAGQYLRVEHPEGGGAATIEADLASLMDALYNIASNAVKYNRVGGEVRIVWRADDYQVDVEISDQGPGIPEVELPYLFDDFFRSRKPELRAKPGTGLGLAIARRVVKAHGGEIAVRTKADEGTTFIISLPR
ncbi:response regulator receiver sensor signal transduction histidine kinase [Desulfarculus baarsii DSM 2075]|uniref:histidine kinase n=1 Tax=Desulfarculus baarsii (strain ATCC 33931 / DSM 2075 / LMG 7858 / VKM B-1802 / 2st14) TaxID=644282 RepID=E1QHS3_DESB2|nr:response regulator receiver sensor signal transduction histidine kinase [Desulfarculus baarsii DSM 2075]